MTVVLTYVNPARAGMIRKDVYEWHPRGGEPRASGDDPGVTVTGAMVAE